MKLASLFVVTFGIGVLSYPAFHTPIGKAFFAEKTQLAEPAPRDSKKTDFAEVTKSIDEVTLPQTEKEYRIIINIPATKLTLYEGTKPVLSFPVAVGQAIYKTPTGKHEIEQIIWNPWWYPPKSEWAKNEKITPPGPRNPLGPVKMELGGDIRVHGTTKDWSIGRAASHGCIRMHSPDAKTLAWYLQSHLTSKSDPSLLEKYKKFGSSSFWVKLDKPVPVDIIYSPVGFVENDLMLYPDLYGKVKDVKEIAAWELFNSGIDTSKLDFSMLPKNIKELKKIDINEMVDFYQ